MRTFIFVVTFVFGLRAFAGDSNIYSGGSGSGAGPGRVNITEKEGGTGSGAGPGSVNSTARGSTGLGNDASDLQKRGGTGLGNDGSDLQNADAFNIGNTQAPAQSTKATPGVEDNTLIDSLIQEFGGHNLQSVLSEMKGVGPVRNGSDIKSLINFIKSIEQSEETAQILEALNEINNSLNDGTLSKKPELIMFWFMVRQDLGLN